MKLTRLIVIVSQLVILSTLAEGQGILSSTIVWEADQTTDVQRGSTTPLSCQFVSKGRQSVEWIQKKGTMTTTYSVTSVEGDWRDVRTNGSVAYVLERDGKSCRMVFERSDSGTYVTMIFEERDVVISQLRFNIKSVRL